MACLVANTEAVRINTYKEEKNPALKAALQAIIDSEGSGSAAADCAPKPACPGAGCNAGADAAPAKTAEAVEKIEKAEEKKERLKEEEEV